MTGKIINGRDFFNACIAINDSFREIERLLASGIEARSDETQRRLRLSLKGESPTGESRGRPTFPPPSGNPHDPR